MRNMTFIPESHYSRVLLQPQTTATANVAYVAPTPAVQKITIRAIVTMGNSADLILTLKSADDALGTNAVDFQTVPIFQNGTRQTDGKSITINQDTGAAIVDFCIEPSIIPQGKTIGLAYGASNAANIIVAEIIETVAYSSNLS